MTKLEICCGDTASLLAAYRGGADRVELCSALEVGGLTPSLGLLYMARHIKAIAKEDGRDFAVHVLVRPRPGDFIYADSEVLTMLTDIQAAIDLGADGVVIGALNVDGTIDMEVMAKLMNVCVGTNVTFHRAFDLVSDPDRAFGSIVTLGCNRLLTSGCAPTAEAGIPTIRHLVAKAPDGFKIMAGCGVNPGNVSKIVELTGVDEVHASARARVQSVMTYRSDTVKMGDSDADEYTYYTTSPEIVEQLVQSIKQR